MRNLKAAGAWALVLLCFVALVPSAAYGQNRANDWVVERARAWDSLFDRSSGWTGADGIYSIPLSGVDAPGMAAGTKTLFVFSDTFIGDVGLTGKRLSGTTMVNNTLALLDGSGPNPENIRFIWGEDGQGDPDSVFLPDTPDTEPGDWYWLSDGISLNGKLYLFALRMQAGGDAGFVVAGVSLLTLPLDSPNPLLGCTQVDTPLFYVPTDGRGEIILGNGIMANTLEAGAPNPDGYIYIYGHQNDPYNKRLVAARVLPEQFEDFSMWRFWDGTGWSADIDAIAPITTRISSEFSVTPLPDGRFVLVFQLDTLSEFVAIRIGASPVGPFSNYKKIWRCPEVDQDPDIYTYNAKAHPHLSKPGELLISYNVNTFDFLDHFADADIYRPRFIRIRMK